jgi:hypothetical protein
MKKYIFLLCAVCTTITSQAQLKVLSNGTAFIQRDSEVGNATLSVGTLPADSLRSYDLYKMGIRAYTFGSGLSNTVGVFGEACQQNIYQHLFSAGVWGMGGNAYSGMSYGVLGSIHNDMKGAGIYGTNCDDSYYSIDGKFSGYFYGPMHIVGPVYSTVGFSSPSDMRLKKDVVSVEDTEHSNGSTLSNLLGLEVLSFHLKTPYEEKASSAGDYEEGSADNINARYASLRHYGVSAQELQKIYPDIVYEWQDGTLAVNYVEMVPLLLRSIQQLKQELDELKGTGDIARKPSYNTGERQTNGMDGVSAATGNRLFQNTPNPFTERTEIRFKLSDDARNAYIYIFDMTGKTVKQVPVDASMQSVTIGGYELSSGIYLYSLVVNGQEIDTRRMILSK